MATAATAAVDASRETKPKRMHLSEIITNGKSL
jgi:hypothetical protein